LLVFPYGYGASITDSAVRSRLRCVKGCAAMAAPCPPPAIAHTPHGTGGLLGVLEGVLNEHAEYVGLTSTQIADATTSTEGDLTLVDISNNINSFDAGIGAIDNGVVSSGFFESLFESLQTVFDQHVLT
jgi:hypothetical protein